MLATRLEKLRFIVQEMDLALVMAARAPSDFFARAIARHILIRAKDFIDHTGALIQPLRLAGHDVDQLRSRRASFMGTFDEYFSFSRTKLAAHVQDVEFLERLELWADIEIVKASYFVEGAVEIYTQALTGTAADWSRFPEATDAGFLETLNRFRGATTGPPGAVRLGTDMLAASRPQTVSLLNFTPTHVRAQQLSCIDIWVYAELALLRRLENYRNAERLIRTRLITDVVSFSDCLTTRTDGDPGHRLVGLDDLLRQSDDRSADPSAIDDFRRVTRFGDELERIRVVRNHVGAHLHLDTDVSAPELVAELEAVSLATVRSLYGRLRRVFHLTCERTFFLDAYRANGVVLSGALSVSSENEQVKPFGQTVQPVPEPRRILYSNKYDDVTMTDALSAWQEGGDRAGLAKDYFWNAFMESPVVEQFAPVERTNAWVVPRPVSFRRAHAFILEKLVNAKNAAEAGRTLELVSECARGDPSPLALLLHRFQEANVNLIADVDYLQVLGELPVHDGAWARAPLVQALASTQPMVVATAAAGLLRRLIEDRDAEPPDGSGSVFDGVVVPLLREAEPLHRLLAALAVASLFTVPTFDPPVVERETPFVHGMIVQLAQEFVGIPESDPVLGRLLGWRDCVGLCVYLGTKLESDGRTDMAETLFRCATDGHVRLTVIPEVRAPAMLNLSVALLRVGDQRRARMMAGRVISESVLDAGIQLRAIAVLVDAGEPAAAVQTILEDLERLYNLNAEQAALAGKVRAALGGEQRGAPDPGADSAGAEIKASGIHR